MKNILLTSYFAGTAKQFQQFMANQNVSAKNILFIDTASKVEDYTGYIDEAYETLFNLDYHVDTLDIASSDDKTSRHQIQHAEIIFIAGGNTFYLLENIKSKNLDQLLIDKINTGTPYIGESAGAIILSPDITYVKTMDDPKSAPNLETYTGLGVTQFSTLPHYLDTPFENETNDIFKSYHDTIDLIPINNEETATILNDEFIKP